MKENKFLQPFKWSLMILGAFSGIFFIFSFVTNIDLGENKAAEPAMVIR